VAISSLHASALFAWLISHQPAVFFSQNKPVTSNQPVVFFSQNKSTPAISQTNRQLTGQVWSLDHSAVCDFQFSTAFARKIPRAVQISHVIAIIYSILPKIYDVG
jgi:hypothetical protein